VIRQAGTRCGEEREIQRCVERPACLITPVRSTTMSQSSRNRPSFPKAYSFGIITGLLFLLSWLGQFLFQLAEVSNEAAEHGSEFQWSEFWPQFFSATFLLRHVRELAVGVPPARVAGGRPGLVLLLGFLPVEGG
jgi:hypothetical protein